MEITIYTTETCPDCKMIKEKLKKKRIRFKEQLMDAEGLTELRADGIFSLTAPILKINDEYYINLVEILEVINKL